MYSDHHKTSRRRFLKGTLAGVGAMALSSPLAMAQTMLTGKRSLTAKDIHGFGVEPGIVELGSNENPLGTSPHAIEAVAERLMSMNRYDFSASSSLRRALANFHGIQTESQSNDRRGGRSSERIIVDAGSGPLLNYIGILGVGDARNGEVIEAEMGYGDITRVFENYKRAGYDTNTIRTPMTGDLVHDLDAMRSAITPKTTLIVISNPNNPTGTIVPYKTLEAFVDAVPKHIIVYIDEAYIEFVREPDYKDATELALTRENVVVTRTFSKVYGMAAMRVGYLMANKPILDRVRLLYPPTTSGMNHLSARAAIAALNDLAFVERVIQTTNDGKDFLYSAFDKLGLDYTKSHSNFMVVDVGMNNSIIGRRLEERGVEVSGRRGRRVSPNHIRVSIGTMRELEVFVNELERALGEVG